MSQACVPYGPMVITVKNPTDISSPNYQENKHYPENMDCNWRIMATKNKTIQLFIKDGEVEKEYVYDVLQHLQTT